jgi:hypothetical protein
VRLDLILEIVRERILRGGHSDDCHSRRLERTQTVETDYQSC